MSDQKALDVLVTGLNVAENPTLKAEGVVATVFLHGTIRRPPPDIERMDPDPLRRYCRDLLERNERLDEYLEGSLEALEQAQARIVELESRLAQVAK